MQPELADRLRQRAVAHRLAVPSPPDAASDRPDDDPKPRRGHLHVAVDPVGEPAFHAARGGEHHVGRDDPLELTSPSGPGTHQAHRHLADPPGGSLAGAAPDRGSSDGMVSSGAPDPAIHVGSHRRADARCHR